MPTTVIMPALGMAQETGKVLRWLKGDGDAVVQGEPLLEIETDKATVELEAPASGVLARVTALAGDVVPVGYVIAEIVTPGESPASTAGDSRRVAASPKARRLARERGVDLSRLSGSGPGGAVRATDILAAPGAPAGAGAQATGLSTVWRLMAERTTQSWTTVPHFFLLREVDAARLAAGLEDARKRGEADITYTDMLVKLAALALREHPRLNARWQGGNIVHNDAINIGLAVATEQGLVAPVIPDADRLSLRHIAERRGALVERAQAGKLRPEDLRDGTFTISNLGMYGIDAFTAIINAPQAAILAVGRIADRVVAVDGRPAVRPMIALGLSCDHRVVDGARGAQFLTTLATFIEEPVSLRE